MRTENETVEAVETGEDIEITVDVNNNAEVWGERMSEEVLSKSFENELVEDMLSLLSSFSSRIYGRRSAQRKRSGVRND